MNAVKTVVVSECVVRKEKEDDCGRVLYMKSTRAGLTENQIGRQGQSAW